MLNQIWHEAEEILSRHKVIDLGEGVHCVTEYRKSVNVVFKSGSYTCRCRQSKITWNQVCVVARHKITLTVFLRQNCISNLIDILSACSYENDLQFSREI